MKAIWSSKKELINYITSPKEKIINSNTIKFKCIAHSFTEWQELWSVWKINKNNKTENHIKLFIIKPTEKNFWAFKELNESHFQNYIGCPKKYLQITKTKNKEWRKKILQKFKTPL